MGETMTFPETVEEFMEQYKIVDREQVYTNGAELVPIFRIKQWFEHEKAQLSCGGTTSDLISKTETVKHLRRMLEATVPNTDYDEGFVDGVEFGISTVSTMPPAQSQSTAGQLNDGARSTAQSTDLIDRGQAIEKFTMTAPQMSVIRIYEAVEILESMPTIQPEERTEKRTETHACDLISRKQAIDAKMPAVIDGQAIDVVPVSVIKRLPSVQPEPPWISVSERLPEESEYYIITANDGVGHRTTFAKFQKKAKSWDLTGARSYWRVIAWMPLPERYKPNK